MQRFTFNQRVENLFKSYFSTYENISISATEEQINIYLIDEDYSNALKSFQSSDNLIKLINLSNESGTILRNPQFSSWSDRNSIALSKVKNPYLKA